jgi:hypothetical protein
MHIGFHSLAVKTVTQAFLNPDSHLADLPSLPPTFLIQSCA